MRPQALREARRLPLLAEAALERNLSLVDLTAGMSIALLGGLGPAPGSDQVATQ